MQSKPSFIVKTSVLFVVTHLLFFDARQVTCTEECNSNTGFIDGAQKFVTVRRSQRRGAKNKAEVLWQPTDMLSDPTCYKNASPILEMNLDGDDANWSKVNVDTKSFGRSIKWTFDVKPCLEYHFRIRLEGQKISTDENDILRISDVIEPLSKEIILKDGHTPDAPTDLKIEVNSTLALISWHPSDCAEGYDLSYMQAGGEDDLLTVNTDNKTSGNLSNLKPCTRYEVFVYAILGSHYNEIDSGFITEPELDVASSLAIETASNENSVVLSWPTWKDVSCIDRYAIKACIGGTLECTKEKVYKNVVGSPFFSERIEGLKPSTYYSIFIRPVFENLGIKSRKVKIRTNGTNTSSNESTQTDSTAMAGLDETSDLVDNKYASRVNDMTEIIWSSSNCNTSYTIKMYFLYSVLVQITLLTSRSLTFS